MACSGLVITYSLSLVIVRVCASVCTCMFTHLSTCMHACVCVCVCVCVWVGACVRVCVCVCKNLPVCMCMCVHECVLQTSHTTKFTEPTAKITFMIANCGGAMIFSYMLNRTFHGIDCWSSIHNRQYYQGKYHQHATTNNIS